MLIASEKPIAEAERRALSMRLARLKYDERHAPRRLVGGLLFFFIALCGLSILTSNVSPLTAIGFWFGGTVLFGLWIGVVEHRRRLKLRLILSRTLESGRLRETRIVATGVIELEEEEDEGACYAFQIADDQIVFISGQQFYPSAKFPNSDFALVDVVGPSGDVVDFFIRKDGKKLAPIRTVPAGIKRTLRVPRHLHVMRGQLEQLEQLIGPA